MFRMKIGVVAFLLSSSIGTAIPTLEQIAMNMAKADWSADYTQIWTNSRGDQLTASAVATGDLDQIQAALLLAGTVISRGVELPVATNGLSALCEILLSPSMREVFFSSSVFEQKKKSLLQMKKSPKFLFQYLHVVRRLFPFANTHYVCGVNLPLYVKVAIYKERVVNMITTGFDNLDKAKVLVPSSLCLDSLEQMFQQLQNAVPINHIDRGEMGLLFDVQFPAFSDSHESPVTIWLTRVFEKLFPSDYFQLNNSGEYKLIIRNDVALEQNYVSIGKLIGLAILNNVPIRVPLDKKFLRLLLSDTPFGENNSQPIDVQNVWRGFYEITSMTALWGSPINPRRMFTVDELSVILGGSF